MRLLILKKDSPGISGFHEKVLIVVFYQGASETRDEPSMQVR